ncbi:metal ABC transporter substrate-binding protein [Arcanobacterium wilhelmae]|uniref:metal ABC transporter substrate-binding protein n=1 Tax=Arcanobacterium wilhelmae TaxID=1803177 RepID=UPI002414EDED|nr:metal ABC transporter substrate-binding protein [Arcanobacterium wilhelmae]WFN89670.1 metal ABC transporter substrate-binding protein [Arcanobacterium wilhelmae]
MKLNKSLAVIAATALSLAACSSNGTSANSSNSAVAGEVSVTTSMYPIEFLVNEVSGGKVKVNELTAPGASAHDAEVSPADVSSIEKTKAMLYIKGFSSAIDEAASNVSIKPVVNIGDSVNLLTPAQLGPNAESEDHDHEGHDHAAEGHDHEAEASGSADADHDHDHAAEASGSADADHDHDGHDHGAFDPHFFTDPSRMALAVAPVVKTLSEIDPANADTYKANGEKLKGKLDALAKEYKDALNAQKCESTTFVVTHQAFGYLADENKLTQVGIAGIDPDTEPSPARIKEVTDTMKKAGSTVIFATSDGERKGAEAVAKEAGATVELLDPAVSQMDPVKDYIAVMENNLKLLKSAMKCK